jgi:radical SAM superfamily enzyme YgiQ (UPF0313 family)
MLYVLTSLRDHGYSVSYLECAGRNMRRQQVLQRIEEAAPRLVGFSVDTDNLSSAASISHDVRSGMGPDVHIVFGGPASHASGSEIMERSAADVLVIGEGEFAALEVADCLLRGQGELGQISGICYRSPRGLVTTCPRPPIRDLDSIPIPDRTLLPDPKTYQASLISGRGCPFKCSFCYEGRMGNKYRRRSPEAIVAEVETLVSLRGVPLFVNILDDTFTADPEHARRVCRLLRQRFKPWKDLLFFCEVRPDVVRHNPWLVDELVEAGAARIQIGIASASLDVLRAYKRLNTRPETVENVVDAFYKAGAPSVYGGFILGGPQETMQTMEQTLDFAKHLLSNVAPGCFECYASFLTPLPGTELRTHPEEYSLRLLDPDLLTSSNFNFCVTETATLTQEMINNFRYRFLDEMDQEVRRLVPTLSRKTIETHWKLSHDFGVSTAYNDRFAYFPRLVAYLDIVGTGKLEPATDVPDSDILERYPTRLSLPVRMEGGRITVTRGPNSLGLNELGSRIFALCSGKLKAREIVTLVHQSLGAGAPPRGEVQADVLAYLRHLDDNYAIFLKDY